jgi:hypothetical protein
MPSDTSNQVEDRFMDGFIAALPQSVVHVLAPDFAIVAIQLVVVLPNVPDRHRT